MEVFCYINVEKVIFFFLLIQNVYVFSGSSWNVDPEGPTRAAVVRFFIVFAWESSFFWYNKFFFVCFFLKLSARMQMACWCSKYLGCGYMILGKI